jgi:TRAP-type C4-dicarboxylate transport system substrate-binding protein
MAASIKKKLHDLIDKIDNESILTQVYELIYKKNISTEGDLWNKLTKEQQREVLLSLEESNDSQNLVSREEAKRNHKKWL